MKLEDETDDITVEDVSEQNGGIAFQPFEFEAARYAHHLDGLELSEAQAREFLMTLFEIMRAFVELGFSHDICGHLFKDSGSLPPDSSGGVV